MQENLPSCQFLPFKYNNYNAIYSTLFFQEKGNRTIDIYGDKGKLTTDYNSNTITIKLHYENKKIYDMNTQHSIGHKGADYYFLSHIYNMFNSDNINDIFFKESCNSSIACFKS